MNNNNQFVKQDVLVYTNDYVGVCVCRCVCVCVFLLRSQSQSLPLKGINNKMHIEGRNDSSIINFVLTNSLKLMKIKLKQ